MKIKKVKPPNQGWSCGGTFSPRKGENNLQPRTLRTNPRRKRLLLRRETRGPKRKEKKSHGTNERQNER